jgi:hypothetical protein
LEVIGHGEPHRIVQAPARLGEPGQELMGAAAGVSPDQHLPAHLLRQLGEGEPDRLNVVGGGVRTGVPGQRTQEPTSTVFSGSGSNPH